jgi:hypothetical protein
MSVSRWAMQWTDWKFGLPSGRKIFIWYPEMASLPSAPGSDISFYLRSFDPSHFSGINIDTWR